VIHTLTSKRESKGEKSDKMHLTLSGRRDWKIGGMMHQANLTEDGERQGGGKAKATRRCNDWAAINILTIM
jgi:hypothetical protein